MNVAEPLAMLLATLASFSIYPVFIYFDRARVRRQARERLETFAESLGLSTNGSDHVSGELRGARLTMSHVESTTGRASTITAAIDPPSDLAMRVEKRTWVPDSGTSKSALAQGTFDDDDFERTFVVSAAEPTRAVVLLDATLRATLLELTRYASVSLTDEGLRLELQQQTMDVTAWAVDAAARVAEHVRTRRGAVPPAADLAAHVDAWRNKASELQLDVSMTPFTMSGLIDGGLVSATVSPPYKNVDLAPATRATNGFAIHYFVTSSAVVTPDEPTNDTPTSRGENPKLGPVFDRIEALERQLSAKGTLTARGVRLVVPGLALGRASSLLLELRDIAEEHAILVGAKTRSKNAYR